MNNLCSFVSIRETRLLPRQRKTDIVFLHGYKTEVKAKQSIFYNTTCNKQGSDSRKKKLTSHQEIISHWSTVQTGGLEKVLHKNPTNLRSVLAFIIKKSSKLRNLGRAGAAPRLSSLAGTRKGSEIGTEVEGFTSGAEVEGCSSDGEVEGSLFGDEEAGTLEAAGRANKLGTGTD